MVSRRGSLLPTLDDAIERYLRDSEFNRPAAPPAEAAELLGA
jgi:hypothetical protein